MPSVRPHTRKGRPVRGHFRRGKPGRIVKKRYAPTYVLQDQKTGRLFGRKHIGK